MCCVYIYSYEYENLIFAFVSLKNAYTYDYGYVGACLFVDLCMGMCALVYTYCTGACVPILVGVQLELSSLACREVLDLYEIVTVVQGLVIPQHRLCAADTCAGLDSWRKDCPMGCGEEICLSCPFPASVGSTSKK